MDDPVCASCRKGLSLAEIERGQFTHLGGRLYCADCVAKMRSVGPVVCPHCGVQDTPLYDGKAYRCRKCGAEVSPKPKAAKANAPKAKPAPAARAPRKPVKKCPYCAAVLPAESLKCRYCGSLLTREAHDLEAVLRQNLRLRFWLGVLLTASVFLLCLLLYVLVQRPARASGQQARAALASTASSAEPATSDRADPLVQELLALRKELEALKAEKAKADAARQPAPPVPGRAANSGGAEQPAPPRPESLNKAPEPEPKTDNTQVAEPPKPQPPRPEESPLAKAAAGAYPAFADSLKRLKAERDYGEAVAACRQFLAAYLDTPHGRRALADQQAVREELETLRDDHVARFRKALADGSLQAARAVVAEYGQYDAPEIREDRQRMEAELEAAERQPARDQARYLAQWEASPTIGRLIAQLARRGDDIERARAAKELGRHKDPAALKALIEASADPDWFVSKRAIDALEALGDPIALPFVARRAKASHPSVYSRAAEVCHALAQADREQFAEAWKLIDPKKTAQDIVEALTLIDKEQSDVTSKFRMHLIHALALLGATDALEVIRTFVEAGDPVVRDAAVAALKTLTGEAPPAPEPPGKPEPTPPAPQPSATPPQPAASALAGKIEPGADAGSIAIQLPSKHGLNKGDTIEVASNGRPVCTVKIVEAQPTRVVGSVVKQLDGIPLPPAGTGITVTLAK